MEAGITRVLALIGLSVYSVVGSAQQIVYARNEIRTERIYNSGAAVSDEVTEFIVTSATDRMIGAHEGSIAARKGTTPEIKALGELMIKDQKRILGELKRLAVLKNITLPEHITENNLGKETGKQFNKMFIKTMIDEHEDAIRLFEKATSYGDPDISEFANKYLPLMKSNLAKIKSIRKRC